MPDNMMKFALALLLATLTTATAAEAKAVKIHKCACEAVEFGFDIDCNNTAAMFDALTSRQAPAPPSAPPPNARRTLPAPPEFFAHNDRRFCRYCCRVLADCCMGIILDITVEEDLTAVGGRPRLRRPRLRTRLRRHPRCGRQTTRV